MEKVNLRKDGKKIWIGESGLYLVKNANGDFNVYNEGEYEGQYCGRLETLANMTEKDAYDYIWSGI